MKKLLFILLIGFFSCKKEEQPNPAKCFVCTETTYYNNVGSQQQVYSKSDTYCNGIPSTVIQGNISSSGTNSDGTHWTKRVDTVCK